MDDPVRMDTAARDLLDLAAAGVTTEDVRARWLWVQANNHREGVGFRVASSSELAGKWDAIGVEMKKAEKGDVGRGTHARPAAAASFRGGFQPV